MTNDATTRAVRASLASAGLWQNGATLLCALSGGADSVALLHALARLRDGDARNEGVRLQLRACYVQHGLRGEATLCDERFARSLCASLDVPLDVVWAGLNATMQTPGVETLARERRRAIFAERMRALEADALLTGHHLDDQAETVLMRLFRGAGMAGLAGMEPCAPFAGGVVLRPFLGLPKRALKESLAREGLLHREDESNAVAATPRNALRNDFLPGAERWYPGAARHVAEAAAALREDERCLGALADALYERALYCEPPVFALQKSTLAAQPVLFAGVRAPEGGESPLGSALASRALRRLYREGLALCSLSPAERELSRADTLALVRLASAPYGETLNLPCGLKAVSGWRYLHLLRQSGEPLRPWLPPSPVPPVPPASAGDPDARSVPVRIAFAGLCLERSPLPASASPPRDANSVALPPQALTECVLRTPRPGDVIHPFGAPGSKPLRRYLTDRKVDAPFRRALPVLAVGSRVLWIPALCTAQELGAPAPAPAGGWRLALCGSVPYLPSSRCAPIPHETKE